MVDALLGRIAQALDSRRIPYMVIGGQAVLLYGEPRLTRDVDITLGAGPEQLPTLLEAAQEQGWRVLADSPQEFVARTRVLPCLDPASNLRIDMIFSFTPFERQAIERARTVRVGSLDARYASPEDLVILKVLAGRARDLEDVRAILLKNPALDLQHIQKWLGILAQGSEDLLARFKGLRPG
jgi:predicted nucleotidyltransferase